MILLSLSKIITIILHNWFMLGLFPQKLCPKKVGTSKQQTEKGKKFAHNCHQKGKWSWSPSRRKQDRLESVTRLLQRSNILCSLPFTRTMMNTSTYNSGKWLFQRKILPPRPFLAKKTQHGCKAERKTLSDFDQGSHRKVAERDYLV